jgi:hypothetical protein
VFVFVNGVKRICMNIVYPMHLQPTCISSGLSEWVIVVFMCVNLCVCVFFPVQMCY